MGVRNTKWKRRISCVAFLLLVTCSFFVFLWHSVNKSALENTHYYSRNDELLLPIPIPALNKETKRCTMLTCFDFTKCLKEFKVYVYPVQDETKISSNYAKILKSIFRSRYYTVDPKQACLFVPTLDPLDRDRLSADYQKFLEKKLKALRFWNNGKNHVIFNLFSGTYPDYQDTIDIDIENAILVKASVSSESFRRNFDISLPLFSKLHPVSSAGYLPGSSSIFPFHRKYWVSFKGKRYLKGIGSETRNVLYKLHNGQNIVLLTTCKHGKHWREIQDQRCAKDNKLYERYDYQELLHNSTFCLAPRGRRLGSFRFLESVSISCIPVSLANSYELPFAEVIDWKKALLNVDERRLYEVKLILKGIADKRLALFRQQNQFLWEAYFSSVEKIIWTVLEIIHHRVKKQVSTAYNSWNSFPGALISSSVNYTFLCPFNGQSPEFTAVLFVKFKEIKNVLELSRNISKANFLRKVVVIWAVSTSIPEQHLWPSKAEIVKVDKINFQNPSWIAFVKTDGIFFVDNLASIESTEINLAFYVWTKFPNRITGIFASSHFWNHKRSLWSYTAKVGVHHDKGYSMILSSAAFYHRYYIHLHTEYFSEEIHTRIQSYYGCQDISLNFLVAHTARLPPVKVLKYDPSRTRHNTAAIKYSIRNACFQLMADVFGYIPLLYSKVAFVTD